MVWPNPSRYPAPYFFSHFKPKSRVFTVYRKSQQAARVYVIKTVRTLNMLALRINNKVQLIRINAVAGLVGIEGGSLRGVQPRIMNILAYCSGVFATTFPNELWNGVDESRRRGFAVFPLRVISEQTVASQNRPLSALVQ
jgi:hypothetical protein